MVVEYVNNVNIVSLYVNMNLVIFAHVEMITIRVHLNHILFSLRLPLHTCDSLFCCTLALYYNFLLLSFHVSLFHPATSCHGPCSCTSPGSFSFAPESTWLDHDALTRDTPRLYFFLPFLISPSSLMSCYMYTPVNRENHKIMWLSMRYIIYKHTLITCWTCQFWEICNKLLYAFIVIINVNIIIFITCHMHVYYECIYYYL